MTRDEEALTDEAFSALWRLRSKLENRDADYTQIDKAIEDIAKWVRREVMQ